MNKHSTVAATRQSAAVFQEVGCRRFAKRRHSGLATLGFCFLLSVFGLRANAQSYSIDWCKIAGGGGTSTNGQFSVSGTIGQPDAGGAMTGGGYSLTGGFWAFQAVQTPGAPTLYITHSGSAVTVFWENVSGWNLYQSGNLATPLGSWSASSGITTSNGTNYLTVVNPTGNMFFRLK
jgi:hypothetical protein